MVSLTIVILILFGIWQLIIWILSFLLKAPIIEHLEFTIHDYPGPDLNTMLQAIPGNL